MTLMTQQVSPALLLLWGPAMCGDDLAALSSHAGDVSEPRERWGRLWAERPVSAPFRRQERCRQPTTGLG
jgi:hypothetical protein